MREDAGIEPRKDESRQVSAAQLAPNAAIVFVGNLVARGLGFLFPLLAAHAVDREQFALVYFFIGTGFFVGELVLTGFPTAVTRYIATSQDAGDAGRWLLAGLAGGLPLLIVSAAIGELLAAAVGAPPWLTTLVVVGLTLDAYYFACLRGLMRFRLLVGYRIGANLAQLVLVVVAVRLGAASLPVLVGIYAATYVLPILVIEAVWAPTRTLVARWRPITPSELGVLARFALPALASGVAYGALMGFDVFFVRLFAQASLADYAAARTLAMPVLMLPFAVSVVLLPRAATIPGRPGLQLLIKAELIAVSAGIALLLVYLVAGPWLIAAFLPPSYAQAALPLRTLVPALVLLGLYSIMTQWWFGRNRPIVPAVCIGCGAVVAIGGHLVITSNVGAVGGGIAIGAGAALALVLLSLATWRND